LAGQESEAIKLLLALDEAGIAVSTGSACSAHHASEPSYVLRAMGFDVLRARGSLRVTLGRFNTAAEVDRFLDVLPSVAAALRPITTRQPESAPTP
jgi:cysteine desulfurase